jgi:hypothetical protein
LNVLSSKDISKHFGIAFFDCHSPSLALALGPGNIGNEKNRCYNAVRQRQYHDTVIFKNVKKTLLLRLCHDSLFCTTRFDEFSYMMAWEPHKRDFPTWG